MGGDGPEEQRGGQRKGKDLMDKRRMEGGRQVWRKERQRRKRDSGRQRESRSLRFISRTTVPEV